MPLIPTFLPPELVALIIEHVSGDTDDLRSCALVSRTWSDFSQRALFRNTHVHLYFGIDKKVDRLLDDLISIPHLQTLVDAVRVGQYCYYEAIPLPTHMSCLASVLALLPNLKKLAFKGGDNNDTSVTPSYLNLIPTVLPNAPLVELNIDVSSAECLRHVFVILAGTNVKRVSVYGNAGRKVESTGTHKRIYLPALERICFGVDNAQEDCYNYLAHELDLPNLKQCEINTGIPIGLLRWRNVLLRGFPPLEVFKLELADNFPHLVTYRARVMPEADSVFRPLPLAGLPFQHVHLSITCSGDLDEIVEWWASTFRALSDSKATIHFTKLTLSFIDLPEIVNLESACQLLDDSLAHPMFSAVRDIHFEDSEGFPPEAILADIIRCSFPQLASCGVLRLV
ncbi:hypothetical protein CPB85DRAFT_1326983 [Mucidula mucida]|nr:hypothetical protein CPB85DRAFT_1326983 [Mucidula mucida]